jgi:hypothetical protein
MDEIWALAFNAWSLLNGALHEAVNFPGDIVWWCKLVYKVAAAIETSLYLALVNNLVRSFFMTGMNDG